MKQRRMKNREGLTLIELVISLAIIAMIAVTMLDLFGAGLLNISRAGNRTINTEAAANHFITSPDAISEEITLIIDLGDGVEDNVEVKGRIGRGSGTLPGYGNIEVDIESFVPGL
ncbi:MAG: prepilin-type N-terminal cleavage/methylation domain-containing protein [Dethiosulfatibacter sp.]|nr:prepilin-type N-terminal cleavage/methylation domain-containing protein [Dethiosulfatibacter sp.]